MTGLTKEKIMDVALELFVARGIRDVSIETLSPSRWGRGMI